MIYESVRVFYDGARIRRRVSEGENISGPNHNEKGKDGSRNQLTGASQDDEGRLGSLEVGEYIVFDLKR